MHMRPATLRDYKEVLALDKEHRVYNGIDYLPHWYKSFVQDPDKDINLLVQDGNIVRKMLIVIPVLS